MAQLLVHFAVHLPHIKTEEKHEHLYGVCVFDKSSKLNWNHSQLSQITPSNFYVGLLRCVHHNGSPAGLCNNSIWLTRSLNTAEYLSSWLRSQTYTHTTLNKLTEIQQTYERIKIPKIMNYGETSNSFNSFWIHWK